MTASETPSYPFLPGQVITVDHPSPYLISLLDGVRAEIVRDSNEPEMAVAVSVERAVVRTSRKRDARH